MVIWMFVRGLPVKKVNKFQNKPEFSSVTIAERPKKHLDFWVNDYLPRIFIQIDKHILDIFFLSQQTGKGNI